MQRYLLIFALLVLVGCTKEKEDEELKKEVEIPGPVIYGDTTGMPVIRKYNISIDIFMPETYEFDLDGDNVKDWAILSKGWHLVTGRLMDVSIISLQPSLSFSTELFQDTSYTRIVQAQYGYDTLNSLTLFTHKTLISCSKTEDIIEHIAQKNLHLNYGTFGEIMDTSANFQNGEILMEMFKTSAFESVKNDTSWLYYYTENSCQQIPKDQTSFIGFKYEKVDGVKYGWIKIRNAGMKYFIEESVMQ